MPCFILVFYKPPHALCVPPHLLNIVLLSNSLQFIQKTFTLFGWKRPGRKRSVELLCWDGLRIKDGREIVPLLNRAGC